MSDRKVKFNKNHTVKDVEGKKYIKDKEYTLSVPSALHFVRRGIADYVVTAAEKKAAKAAEDASQKAKDDEALAEQIVIAKTALEDANKAVINAETALENADDADEDGAKSLLEATKDAAKEAEKFLKALEK